MTFKDPDFRHSYAATGVDPGIISNRIGNVFDLNGPRCDLSLDFATVQDGGADAEVLTRY
jgi:hypothetical protein